MSSRTGSALNAGMRPSLVAGGGGKGMIATNAAPGHIQQPVRSGQLWVDSFGNSRYKLGVLINSPGQFWNDLDLFQVTAANNMLLSDVFIWKLVATSAMNSITTILAPKVAVPNDIHTFTGRTMYYHVQPANDVPKRGTVRTMSKSMEEWVAHLSQKGMGSHIEGGALRTPQGKRFLDQEVIAIAWSIELNMVLNTVNTIVNAAIASGFNATRQESMIIDALSMGKALNREIEIFCAGCGSPRTLQTLLTQYVETVPNADVLYMTNRLASNLQFASELPGSDLPHKSYAMIPDETGVSVPVSIVGRNRTRTLKTIAGGTLAVLAMPTFSFRGGESRYNPLEHDFTCGNHWTLNAERGLVTWDKLAVPNMDSKSYYCSDSLDQDIYDHNQDRRDRVHFKTAMKYARVFNTVGDKYHHYDTYGSNPIKTLHEFLYSEDMIKFAGDYEKIDKDNHAKMFDKISASNSFISNLVGSTQNNKGTIGMIVNESPISSDVQQHHPLHGTTSKDRVGFHEAVQRFKANIQFPLSRCYNIDDIGNGLTTLKLPTTIGDLDPFHFLGVNLKSCVCDAKKDLLDSLRSDQYNSFIRLKRMLTTGRLNQNYWNLVIDKNMKLFDISNAENQKTENNRYFGLKNQDQSINGWPLDRTNFMVVPTYDEYAEHVRNKQQQPESSDDYIPQGLWSFRGLQYLANPALLTQTNINRLASDSLDFLQWFSTKISQMFPFSTVSNAHDNINSLARFLPANTVVSDMSDSVGVTSDANMQQIIMSLFDEKLEMTALSLKKPGSSRGEGGQPEKESGELDKVPTKPASMSRIMFMNAHVPMDGDVGTAQELRATIYLNKNNGKVEPLEIHFTGDPWTFFQEDLTPETNTDFVTAEGIYEMAKKPNQSGEPFYQVKIRLIVILLEWIYSNGWISESQLENFNDKSLEAIFNRFKGPGLPVPPAQLEFDKIYIHIKRTTAPSTKTDSSYYLTPFVVSMNQNPLPDIMKLHNMYDLDEHNREDTSRQSHVSKITDIDPNLTTGWRAERIKEFVVNTVSKKQWTALDKIISLFIIETQLSLASMENWIHQGLRPIFEVCIWRLFQRQRFEGLLLAKSGISTAMNPYNNAHINMGIDATTDQYNVRAVIQTDCVVINSQNLAFIPCVSPTQYLGGRNNNFITSPDEIMNTDRDCDKIPSMIATIVSYGYMASTDYPLSFINNPPGRIANSSVTDVNSSTQVWPGAAYYYDYIYKPLFYSADKVYHNLKLDMNSDQHKRFVQWYRAQMDGNHVSTPGYSKCYDPMTGNYTYELNGKGHYQYSFMNDSGARMVFEGVQSNFRTYERVPISNT